MTAFATCRYLLLCLALVLAAGGASACARATPLAVAPEAVSAEVTRPAVVEVKVSPGQVQRTVTRQILGQGVWYSWQAYAWDGDNQRTWPGAMELFEALGMGIVGHYPGVGVITHDFHWQNLIRPLDRRRDPTPRQESFDTPQFLEFGPDEYGQFLEAYRKTTGRNVEGSIQVNIMSGTAEEAADWVEYMNAPNDGSNPGGGVDWAAVRAANGHPEPYRIRYWELGNEPHFTASEMGELTAAEYVARIQEFVPLMKERDPSIEVMAYVNPFQIGDRRALGTATADILTPSGLTWTQTVIRDAGEYLDRLYFHWYGGWNERVHDYEFLVTSMYTGLIPWLDRLAQDIERFAPSDAARERLRRVFIPEWNVYGGWTKPLARGTALQGAIAYSRTLHVFASRDDVYSAQHMGLAAPYPTPRMKLGLILDIREGYFTIWCREDESDFMGTALLPVAQLWSRAFAPQVVQVTTTGTPTFANGVPVLDVTALRSTDGGTVNLILTNAGASSLSLQITLENFVVQPNATRLFITGSDLADNNSWEDRDIVVLKQEVLPVTGTTLTLSLPPYSVQAVLLEGTSSQPRGQGMGQLAHASRHGEGFLFRLT